MKLVKDTDLTYILILSKGEKVMESLKKAFLEIKKNDPSVNGGFVPSNESAAC